MATAARIPKSDFFDWKKQPGPRIIEIIWAARTFSEKVTRDSDVKQWPTIYDRNDHAPQGILWAVLIPFFQRITERPLVEVLRAYQLEANLSKIISIEHQEVRLPQAEKEAGLAAMVKLSLPPASISSSKTSRPAVLPHQIRFNRKWPTVEQTVNAAKAFYDYEAGDDPEAGRWPDADDADNGAPARFTWGELIPYVKKKTGGKDFPTLAAKIAKVTFKEPETAGGELQPPEKAESINPAFSIGEIKDAIRAHVLHEKQVPVLTRDNKDTWVQYGSLASKNLTWTQVNNALRNGCVEGAGLHCINLQAVKKGLGFLENGSQPKFPGQSPETIDAKELIAVLSVSKNPIYPFGKEHPLLGQLTAAAITFYFQRGNVTGLDEFSKEPEGKPVCLQEFLGVAGFSQLRFSEEELLFNLPKPQKQRFDKKPDPSQTQRHFVESANGCPPLSTPNNHAPIVTTHLPPRDVVADFFATHPECVPAGNG